MEERSNYRSLEPGIYAVKWGITEDLLATVLEALPMGIAIADADGKVVICNREMRRFLPTGILPFRDDDRYWRWRAFHPDGTPLERHEFPSARALRGETVYPGVDMIYTGENGQEVWVRYAAFPIQNVETRGRVLLMVTEITTRKEAAVSLRNTDSDNLGGGPGKDVKETISWLAANIEQLEKEEHSLENLTNIEPLLIYTYLLTEKRFTYLNTPLQQLIAREKDYVDAMGAHLFQALLHPEDGQPHATFLEGLTNLKEGEVRTLDCRLWKKGAFRWFRCRSSIFLGDHERVSQVISIFEDITLERSIFGRTDFQTGPLN